MARSKRTSGYNKHKKRGGCGCAGSNNSNTLGFMRGGSDFGLASINTKDIGLNNTIPNYSVNTHNSDPIYMAISSRNLPNISGGKKSKKSKRTKKSKKTNKRKTYKRGGSILSTFIPIPIGGLFGPNQVNSAPNIQPITGINDSNPALI